MASAIPNLRERLEQLGYPSRATEEVSQQLQHLQGDLRRALEHWLETGEVELSLKIEGYTIPRLMEEFGMTVPAALLTLDWLQRSPQEALAALEHGIDLRL